MSWNELLTKLSERKEKHVDDYQSLVASIVKGETPDPETVERTLVLAGRTLENLQSDVEQCRERMALKAKIAMIPKLEQQCGEIEKEISKADRVLEAAERRFEEAQRRHNETVLPLDSRRREILLAIAEAKRAIIELVENCPDSKLRDERRKLLTELTEIAGQQRDLNERIDFHRNQILRENRQPKARKDIIQHHEGKIKETEHQLKELQQRKTEQEKRLAKLEDRMREA